jgi:hypothetical protein
VVSSHLHHRATWRRRRDSEPVTLPLDDEYRQCHGIELRQPARRWFPGSARRRLQRKGQAQDTCGACFGRRAARDAGTCGAATDDEREPSEVRSPQVVDDGRPGGVELVCWSLRSSSRDAVGLLHERHGEPVRERGLPDRDEVSGADSATRAVSQGDGAASLARRVQVRSREPVGSLDLDRPHPVMLPAGTCPADSVRRVHAAIRSQFLGTARPASMLLVVSALPWPQTSIEIQAWAARAP